ncbi:flagellar hook-associated protein 2 [Bordetella ansorpii]|uniref:Flagellar hook-associated protein 2 n=1 Tax=Bordetella ansorpii TaxID=288768 RepID=A0A157M1V5_9BORD|nr:flagellar filament capping protein FliD [Bordetella ansorpii]SAI02664.1 flagellar hook-associated protein 2 [Bordetella ansorpii]
MATITSLGAGTSLDLETILTSLQANNEVVLDQLSARQESYEVKVSSFSQLQSSVQSVLDAAKALAKVDTLNAVKSTVSGSAVTVTTVAGATPGQYSVTVNQVATAQRLQSASALDRTEKHGASATLEIELENGTKTTITTSDTSLDGIAKAINANDESGVNATIINDGQNGSYLMLTAKDTGQANTIKSINVTDNTELGALLNYTSADPTGGQLVQTQEALDAEVTINGIAVTSASNSITEAVDGVTFDISPDAEPNDVATVSITSDPQAIKDAVTKFVNAYNSLQTTLYNLTSFSVADETQNPLTGDSTARNIQTSLASALQVVSGEGALQTLNALGISTNPDKVAGVGGTLTVDSTKLTNALNSNPADVARVLAGPNGLAASITTATDAILGSSGSIKHRQDGLQETVDAMQKQYDNTESRMTAELDNMRARFVQLTVLVNQMNSTSSYLTQQFAALSKSTS